MKIVFCFTKKTFRGAFSGITKDYITRISRYVPVEVIEPKQPRLQRRQGFHIVLSPDAPEMTSTGFASLIENHLNKGTQNLFFYTGPPDGMPEALIKKADMGICLSRMTFNHQIIRVMLLEQVYRAFTIIRNEPYHR
ncbi:MAG: 23S rRNA (pseudouridine(1915)-N(3))-methyltransferase RlmH [Thermodesulfobacteriota bacterium]|nr:23S rRNA (pseudouridine(1915)-N(3))-methyltransferase RlmH [Thermodesulfobacteriota bacterium]